MLWSECAIVNYATGDKDTVFGRGQIRLVNEAVAQGYKGDFVLVGEIPDIRAIVGPMPGKIAYFEVQSFNAPAHPEVPFGFKPPAMLQAMDMGYRYLLWADSSILPVAPMTLAFDIIAEAGYLFCMCGWKSGEWMCDSSLDIMKLTRDEAMEMNQLMGGIQGLDIGFPVAYDYLRRWDKAMREGAFHGPLTNENKQASSDPRCLGHRNDQSVGSVIAHRLGMCDFRSGVALYDATGTAPRPESTLFLVKSA